ncbi:MAG: desulfoferrodoxin [Butyricicoccus pullicaecorum]|nr:desulfoferrodoxin [Butyricicoccus pullicaecorum]
MELNFYICNHCGNVVEKVVDHKIPILCCGEKMQLLDPSIRDGAGEKHIPVLSINGNIVKVSVGEVSHPMEEKHNIAFIALHTQNGVQRKNLLPSEAPEATFALADGDQVIAVYAYCNLHGLWKTEA